MAKSTFKIPSLAEIEGNETGSNQVPSAYERLKAKRQQAPSIDDSHKPPSATDDGGSYQSHLLKQRPVDNSSHNVTQQTNTSCLKKSSESLGKSMSKPDTSRTLPSDQVQAQKTTVSNDYGKNKSLKSTMKNCIVVNTRQRGNPILKSVRNVPWEYGDLVPDYEVGASSCVLYLSLRYHKLNPNYIHDRMKQLGRSYNLRVLMVMVDVKDPHHSLKELAKICILAEYTLILAFSNDEAGRYLETYKAYENKPPDAIMERAEGDYVSQVTDCLTSVKSVNKTNAVTLISTFGSLADVFEANEEELGMCPGFGPQKAQRLYKTLHEPFLKEPNKN